MRILTANGANNTKFWCACVFVSPALTQGDAGINQQEVMICAGGNGIDKYNIPNLVICFSLQNNLM